MKAVMTLFPDGNKVLRQTGSCVSLHKGNDVSMASNVSKRQMIGKLIGDLD